MNTTGLIAHWTMSGARRDKSGQFRAFEDVQRLLSGGLPEGQPQGSAPFRVRGADAEEWRPLVFGPSGSDQGQSNADCSGLGK